MHPVFASFALLVTVPALAVCATADARPDPPVVSHCQTTGEPATAPIGDRDGHAVSSGAFTCTIESGPLADAVVTGSVVYVWDGGQGVVLAGHAVATKPGALYVSQTTQGRASLVLRNGKLFGLTGEGTGVFRLATGAAAALSGRHYHYVVKAAAPGRFLVETTLDAR